MRPAASVPRGPDGAGRAHADVLRYDAEWSAWAPTDPLVCIVKRAVERVDTGGAADAAP